MKPCGISPPSSQYVCSLPIGHTGPHVALTGNWICRIYTNDTILNIPIHSPLTFTLRFKK